MGQFIQEGSRTMFETIVDVKKPAQDLFIDKLEGNFDGLHFLAEDVYKRQGHYCWQLEDEQDRLRGCCFGGRADPRRQGRILRGRHLHSLHPVSYTHLDVYKRQVQRV